MALHFVRKSSRALLSISITSQKISAAVCCSSFPLLSVAYHCFLKIQLSAEGRFFCQKWCSYETSWINRLANIHESEQLGQLSWLENNLENNLFHENALYLLSQIYWTGASFFQIISHMFWFKIFRSRFWRSFECAQKVTKKCFCYLKWPDSIYVDTHYWSSL